MFIYEMLEQIYLCVALNNVSIVILALFRYHKRPRMKAQKMENLSIAFSFMLEVEHIPLVNIGKHALCVTMVMAYFVGLWNLCFIYRQVKEFKR